MIGAPTGVAVFLEPDSDAGRAAEQQARALGWIDESVTTDFDDTALGQFVTTLIAELSRSGPIDCPTRHPAISDTLEVLPALVAVGPVHTSEVARQIGISTTRLTHLFTAQVGIPLRRYILWLRLTRAIAHTAAGHNLTESAHAAGFSDSAHLTRTCRETFGLPPSALSRNTDWQITHSL
ncbi:helix-turn-helix transcriptional regulator [Nocardia noduli]|uniref:helix-turn-helix transcriptional regulator n=1 Tax=Nocardia noduli TaxID=2815722 RepID=UPI0020B1F4B1|nr:helix-turn-helix transcriptional regulator [Nocardia noduli]